MPNETTPAKAPPYPGDAGLMRFLLLVFSVGACIVALGLASPLALIAASIAMSVNAALYTWKEIADGRR